MILLHTYLPDPAEEARQKLTEQFLQKWVEEFTAAGLKPWSIPIAIGDPFHYYGILAAAWGQGEGVLVLERDVVPTMPLIHALLGCRHDICFADHPQPFIARETVTDRVLHLARPPLDLGYARVVWETGDRTQRYIGLSEKHADFWPLGCTRFSVELTRSLPFRTLLPQAVGWSEMDALLSKALHERGHKGHVHRGAEHVHPVTPPEEYDAIVFDYPFAAEG